MNILRASMVAALAASAVLLCAPPSLADLGSSGQEARPALRYLVGGRRVAAPFAHIVFCARLPTECISGSPPALAGSDTTQIQAVNDSVNARIRARLDAPGTDEWTLDPTAGDCEDYAITKRHELLALGWPARALRLATALTRDGVGHMVLIVTTQSGDMVLDSRTDVIVGWRASDLRFMAVQSQEDPHVWLMPGEQAPMSLAASGSGAGSR